MLYDLWRATARICADDLALAEVPGGRSWTFRDLAREVERMPTTGGGVAFPQTNCAAFVLEVLRAWRDRQIVCPLEPGQERPQIQPGLRPDIAHLKMTSATTAAPRLVAFTGPQLCADARNIVASMGLRRDWPNVGVVSLAHSYGFSNLVLPLLLHGVPLLMAGSALPEALRRAARAAEAVTVAGVPALWRAWHEGGALAGNIRLAISAGAPLPLPLEQAVFAETGIKIHNFYGSSECGGIAYDAEPEPRPDAACAGAPLTGVHLEVADDGCVEVRGDAVGTGYWPEADERLGSGVFRTRDLGEVDEGVLYLRGRATDQVNVAGRKVSPETIETVLLAHSALKECVVFGVPSPEDQRGEVIVACVALEPHAGLDTLKQHAIARLPAWQVPREWWVVERLHANQRGKISRAALREAYLAEKLRG